MYVNIKNMNTITISKEIKKDLKNVSRDMGISEDTFLTNAIAYYLDDIKRRVEFKKELEMWSQASAEDTEKFEKNI
jgi:hypothetical protein